MTHHAAQIDQPAAVHHRHVIQGQAKHLAPLAPSKLRGKRDYPLPMSLIFLVLVIIVVIIAQVADMLFHTPLADLFEINLTAPILEPANITGGQR